MRKLLVFLAVLALVIAGAVALRSRDEPVAGRQESAIASDRGDDARVQTPERTGDHAEPHSRALQQQRRDALRDAILQRLAAADRLQGTRQLEPGAERKTNAAEKATAADGKSESKLNDRIGRPDVLAALNREFMPLAGECIDDARERLPALNGLLAIELSVLADSDLGAVIDSVEPAPDNQVADPELLQCIQQSILTVAMPPPGDSGRDEFMISLRVGEPVE